MLHNNDHVSSSITILHKIQVKINNHWIECSFRDPVQPSMTCPAQTWRGTPQLWRDSRSRSFSPRRQKLRRRRTMDLWTIRFPSPPALHCFTMDHQDRREVKQRLRFGDDFNPFLGQTKYQLILPQCSVVTCLYLPFQVQEDFENSFRPGFSQFGNFGPSQTNGRTVWGAPAETWDSLAIISLANIPTCQLSDQQLMARQDLGHYSPPTPLHPHSFCF